MGNYDLLIVGGGMVGLTLALALKDSGLSIAVVDSQPGAEQVSGEAELRVSAISYASQNILNAVGAWDGILAQRLQPYTQMSVWEQDSFANIEFDCQQVDLPQLGHIIENKAIRSALWQQAELCPAIQLLAPEKISKLVFTPKQAIINLESGEMLTANLVVGADGANSFVRQQANLPVTFWDYEHTAIVATINTAESHTNTARQIFTPDGPLAFLPLWQQNQCSIVWSVGADKAQQLLQMSESDFSKALTSAFDNRLGLCELISSRQSYPLKMRYVRQWLDDRVVVIGDAAHTIHPLAGQGVNLGLADAAALAEAITDLQQQGLDIGDKRYLRQFERWRKTEASKMIAAMEGFKRLFAGNDPIKKLIRDLGMSAVNQLPLAKDKVIRHAMGLEGELPKMAQAYD